MGRILRIAKTEVARLKLDRDVREWLKNWPPVVTPMPSNEPGATEAESLLGWNWYTLEWPEARPHECGNNGNPWPNACFWAAVRGGLNGTVEVVPGQDHTNGKPFGKDFACCQGLCKTTPRPMEWRAWKYGKNYWEHYK